MSDEVLSVIITVLILGALFLWVPTSSFCNERCQRWFEQRRNRAADPSRPQGELERQRTSAPGGSVTGPG